MALGRMKMLLGASIHHEPRARLPGIDTIGENTMSLIQLDRSYP
jgi:hypothetical protein